VDLFFVLSGFLITRILLGSRSSHRYYFNFYARRILRIWPLYYAVLGAAYLILPLFFAHFRQTDAPYPAGYYVVFVQNWFLPLMGSGLLGVTWSLAVEEQFYLLWPFVVRSLSPRSLYRLLIAVLLACPVLRLIAASAGISWQSVYIGTPYRADAIAAGALIAVLHHEGVRIYRFSLAALGLGSVAAAAVLATTHGHRMNSPLIFSANALLFGGALGLALSTGSQSLFRRVLRLRPLTFTGEISYGIYLLHGFVLTAYGMPSVRRLLGRIGTPFLHDSVVLAVGLGLSYLVAWISWATLERPVLRLKDYFYEDPRGSEAQRNFAVAVGID
jgi:peptidoglycan/LPS O-acetylase OafA/YrhL